ncbi:MAG: CAP domain-containing protein [Elainellaceae cyanobacterium]
MMKRFWISAFALAVVACSQSNTAPSSTASNGPEDTSAAESTASTEVAESSGGDGAEPTSELAAIEQQILEQINQYREEQGLTALRLDEAIQQQAQQHSSAMAQGTTPVSHQGFDDRVEAIAKSIDYRSAAENVAYNEGYSSPGEQAVQGWLDSPGHLENIQGDYTLTGIGVAQDGQAYYFTQIFIKTP